MTIFKTVARFGASIVLATMFLSGAVVQSRAQNAADMSCDALWYARNAIYARHGYCFKTDRGRAAFGPGCFPPYGAVSGAEQNRINELQYWERQRGC